MTAPYLPPCRCPEPEEGDPSTHLPGCPHYDSAHDPPALADEPARSYWRASDKPPKPIRSALVFLPSANEHDFFPVF